MAKTVTVWANSDMSLYRISDNGEPEYMPCAGVFRVMQGNGGWRVILYGYFPIALDLFNHGGAIFEVCHNVCGPRGLYEITTCVMRFSNCEIVRKWIRQPSALSPAHVEPVYGYIEMSCDVWVTEEVNDE